MLALRAGMECCSRNFVRLVKHIIFLFLTSRSFQTRLPLYPVRCNNDVGGLEPSWDEDQGLGFVAWCNGWSWCTVASGVARTKGL